MAFVPGPGVSQVNINQRLHGQQVQNTIYTFNGGTVWTAEDLLEQATSVWNWWEASMLPNLSSQLTMVEVTARSLSDENAPIATYSESTPPQGGATAESLPAGSAIVISFRTGLSGRSFRGRNYVAGIPESVHSFSAVTAEFLSAVVAAYQDLPAALAGSLAPSQHVVFSRISNGVERATGVSTPVITYLAVDATVDSQRRRLPTRGR